MYPDMAQVLVHVGATGATPCGVDSGKKAYATSARSHICFNDQSPFGRPGPKRNCRLRIRCASSIPARVMFAVRNDLKPSIDAHRRLIAR